MSMENWEKEKVMSLNNDELLIYINHMLGVGYSLAKLNEKKGIRRQTIRERLKKDGYAFDRATNSFRKMDVDAPKEEVPAKPIVKNQQMTLEQLQRRLELLEKKVNAMQVGESNGAKTDLVRFNSKEQARNYPLHTEVIDLLAEVHSNNRHLKVKDIVNHALYIGLTQMNHSEKID